MFIIRHNYSTFGLFRRVLLASLFIVTGIHAVSKETLAALAASFDSRPYVGMEIVQMPDGQQLYCQNEGKLFVPASNVKLVTSAAALHYLGSEFTFTTKLFYADGNLYVKGDGDPSLASEDMHKVIRKAIESGISTVNNVIIDTSEFDEVGYAPGTSTDDIGSIYLVPVGSLIMDRRAVLANSNELYPPSNVTTYAQFGQLFLDAGIKVQGTIIKGGVVETAALIAEHKSQPLRALVAKMLQESDNLYADCLCKKLGTLQQKSFVNWGAGTATLRKFLVEVIGIHPAACILRDGSGMSRYNALTPHTIVQLLRAMSTHPAAYDFKSSLPLSGFSGTLKERLKEIAGMVQAKTGTMGGITTLSGYIIDKNQQEYIFSILVNNCINDASWPKCKQEVEDAVCLAVAQGSSN